MRTVSFKQFQNRAKIYLQTHSVDHCDNVFAFALSFEETPEEVGTQQEIDVSVKESHTTVKQEVPSKDVAAIPGQVYFVISPL